MVLFATRFRANSENDIGSSGCKRLGVSSIQPFFARIVKSTSKACFKTYLQLNNEKFHYLAVNMFDLTFDHRSLIGV